MENEPKFTPEQPRLTFDILRNEIIEMEGINIDPENFAKYLIWSLTRSGASKEEILSAVERFNSEFPQFLLEETNEPVGAATGVSAGKHGNFKFKKSVQ